MNSPSETVRNFIAAHFAWNKASNELTKPLDPESDAYDAAMQSIRADYDNLIRRLCASSVVRQGVSFGDRPSHHPDKESIELETVSALTAIVQTMNVAADGFVAKYEYRLAQEAGEWRISSLLYVDGDEKYECL